MAFLCFLGAGLEIYDPVLPKVAGRVLRAIEEKTDLPVANWTQTMASPQVVQALGLNPGGVGHLQQRQALADSQLEGEPTPDQPSLEEEASTLITLTSIKFQGVTLLGDMELKGIVAPFINKPMTYEKMLDIGMEIESYYRRNNYLARAMLAPQDLTDGVLTVDVIESVFTQIEIEQELDQLPKTQDHVMALIKAQQKPGEPLNTKSLDRGLALANDLPGLSVQGKLREGKENGETDLLLSIYQGRTRQVELTVDNGGSRSTGALRSMASMTWFNPNDWGDLFNLTVVHTLGSDYARLAYSLPIGLDGWRMGANFSLMKYDVIKGEQGMVGAFGQAVTRGLEWVYPLLRADDRSATVTLTADAKSFQNTSAQGLLMSDYQAKVLAAQISGFYRDLNPGGGTGTYSLQLSHGNINLDGSLSQSTDATTVKSEGVFNKIRLNSSWQQALSTETSALVTYSAQLADKNLDSSEKMQLGGMNGVRAYPTGACVARCAVQTARPSAALAPARFGRDVAGLAGRLVALG